MIISVDLLQYQNQLTTKTEDSKTFLWDPIRKKYLVNQPEELVRQLLILHLQKEGISKNFISIEKAIKVNQLIKRFDLLIYDKNHEPILLVECKAPKVKLNQETFKQIAWYNTALKVPYLLVTNGITTYCCSVNYKDSSFSFLKKIPKI